MLTLNANEVLQLVNLFYSAEQALRGKRGPIDGEKENNLTTKGAEEIARICRDLGLPMTGKTALAMLQNKTTLEGLHGAITQIMNTFHLEIESRTYFGPLPQYQAYYNNPKLFGEDVFNRFPVAADDIYEAGCCLAFERPTACVMHLMRVLEAGLSALAADLGVPKQNDWGAYLRKIQEELDARTKGLKARSGDEQFYAEAAANFDRLRRAYRNPTMHVDKSYSQERAEEIMQAVRSFMVHLATRLMEAAP